MTETLPSKPLPSFLTERYRAWYKLRFEENRAWYSRLAREGQRPRAMVVSCCDSRVDVVGLFGAEPGDLFVVRNVASLIPPYSPDHSHHGTSAAVEFAVTGLKVTNLVVIGHSSCGGVAACHDMCAGLAPHLEQTSSFIGRWMDIMRPAYEALEGLEDRAERLSRLEREGVRVSLGNLWGFPFVKEAVQEGRLALHGAWIDIAEGQLHVLSSETGTFAPL